MLWKLHVEEIAYLETDYKYIAFCHTGKHWSFYFVSEKNIFDITDKESFAVLKEKYTVTYKITLKVYNKNVLVPKIIEITLNSVYQKQIIYRQSRYTTNWYPSGQASKLKDNRDLKSVFSIILIQN